MDVQRPSRNRSAQWFTLGRAGLVVVTALLCSVNLAGQTAAPELRQILERLEGLERSNRELREEVRTLRDQLATPSPRSWSEGAEVVEPAAAPTPIAIAAPSAVPSAQPASEGPGLDEQVAILNARVAEQAQTKVESGQRFPIRLKGMLLFNSFLNSKQAGGEQYPTVAVDRADANGGADLRQSIFGFEYRGPEVFGGKLHASMFMDFYGASGQPLDLALRIRTATMQIDWKSRSLKVGVDKPIFAPRDPTSLAQVEVSPLTAAGNLWMWIPQVRLEQSFNWSDTSGVRAQGGVVATREIASYQTGAVVNEIERSRPGLEGRVEFWHDFGAGRRVELAPGFHVSTSHVTHVPVPSRVFSTDWLVSPWRKLEFTGAFFTGENVAHLGGLGQGFLLMGPQQVLPLHSVGGWAQLTVPATDRLSFHFFSGVQDDRNIQLPAGQIDKNLAYGANFFYRLAPNLIMSLEASQVRTTYIQTGHRLNNHYDLSFAYLF
jgi:hypothetical protein